MTDDGSNIVLSQARLLSNISLFHATQGQAISWLLAGVHSEMSVGQNYVHSDSSHRHQRLRPMQGGEAGCGAPPNAFDGSLNTAGLGTG